MSSKSPTVESGWTFVGLALAVVALGCSLWYLINRAYPDLADRASFGNLFGGINALFAGLAFAGLTYTLILQQRSLDLQRGELRDQQEELRKQNDRFTRQQFETMLLQLLGFHHEITREVRVGIAVDAVDGRQALRELADELRSDVLVASRGRTEPAIVLAQEAYENFHKRFRGVLDHYFRNLYHIVKFVDSSGIDDPRRYTSLVRAQLSPAELSLLFYNGVSLHGEKFKPLIEKYGLFEQLPDAELELPGHKSLYAQGAYS